MKDFFVTLNKNIKAHFYLLCFLLLYILMSLIIFTQIQRTAILEAQLQETRNSYSEQYKTLYELQNTYNEMSKMVIAEREYIEKLLKE